MVQSRGGKTGYPAKWVTPCIPKPIIMRTNTSYIALRLLGRRTMQLDGQSNDLPCCVGNCLVFHGSGKSPELKGTEPPVLRTMLGM